MYTDGCQSKTAYHVTVSIIMSSALMYTPLFSFFNNSSSRCVIDPPYSLAYTTYSPIFIGVLLPLLLVSFSYFSWFNVTKIRWRVQPIGDDIVWSITLHKCDHDLMKVLVSEIFISCVAKGWSSYDTWYSISKSHYDWLLNHLLTLLFFLSTFLLKLRFSSPTCVSLWVFVWFITDKVSYKYCTNLNKDIQVFLLGHIFFFKIKFLDKSQNK